MNSRTTKNRQILLASRPDGEPSDENFKLVEVEIPRPGPGQMLVRTIYLSLDPSATLLVATCADGASRPELAGLVRRVYGARAVRRRAATTNDYDVIIIDRVALRVLAAFRCQCRFQLNRRARHLETDFSFNWIAQEKDLSSLSDLTENDSSAPFLCDAGGGGQRGTAPAAKPGR